MLNVLGKQSLNLMLAQESINVEERWCQGQQKDLSIIFEKVDELLEMCIGSNESSLAYQQFQQSKTDFVSWLIDCYSKYRRIKDSSC